MNGPAGQLPILNGQIKQAKGQIKETAGKISRKEASWQGLQPLGEI